MPTPRRRPISSLWGARAQEIFPLLSKGQDDFADMLAALHASMRSGHVMQFEGGIDHWLDRSGGDQLQDFGLDRAGDRSLVGSRTRAQRRAGMGEPFEHEPAEIDSGARRSLKGDLYDPPFDCGGIVVAV